MKKTLALDIDSEGANFMRSRDRRRKMPIDAPRHMRKASDDSRWPQGGTVGRNWKFDVVDTKHCQCALRVHATALEFAHTLRLNGTRRLMFACCERHCIFEERAGAYTNTRR